jgi:antitoxin component HigA of HigAB toxin-antitoxin module
MSRYSRQFRLGSILVLGWAVAAGGADGASKGPASGGSSVADLCATRVLDVFRKAHPGRSDDEYEKARKLFKAAFEKGPENPTEEQMKAILADSTKQAGLWDRYAQMNADPGVLAVVVQYRIFWYLTTPELSESDVAKQNRQRAELVQFMRAIPDRLIKEFGVREELRADVTLECEHAVTEFESAISTPFLRPAQAPLEEQSMKELQDVLESEVVRLGKQLAKEIDANRVQWQREMAMKRPKLPEDLGAILLQRQQKITSTYITFLYGMGMRKYLMPRFDKMGPQGFALTPIKSYGVYYNNYRGFYIYIIPKDRVEFDGRKPNNQADVGK